MYEKQGLSYRGPSFPKDKKLALLSGNFYQPGPGKYSFPKKKNYSRSKFNDFTCEKKKIL